MTLDHLIRTYIGNTGNNTLHGYIQYLHWAIQGLKQAKINLGYDVNTVKLEIDFKKQSQLPNDYLKWTSMSVLSGDRLINMVYDESIIDPSFDEREPYSSVSHLEVEDEFGFLVSMIRSENIETVRGQGKGYFMIDTKAEVVQFDARLDIDAAYMTYVSNKFKPNSETEIHPFVADMLIDYIHWQKARYSRQYGEASMETRLRKQEYLNKLDMAVANFMNLHVELFIDIMNRSTSLAPIRNL